MDALEAVRGEVFELYIAQKWRLKDVMKYLREMYGLAITPKRLKTRLDRWGFYKNIKRVEVVEIMRQTAHRKSKHKRTSIIMRERPVSLSRVEKHRKRAGLAKVEDKDAIDISLRLSQAIVCRTPPPTLVLESYRVPERLLYNVDILIKGSFESRDWSFANNESLILSSLNTNAEKINLQAFLGDIDSGCAAATTEDFQTAGSHWRQAFRRVEGLVRAQYHDIIPNVIQKINDLKTRGRPEVAALLKKHIADCSETSPNPRSSIFVDLGRLDVEHFSNLEESIMDQFNKLFHFYLGQMCYNSFVMMMNAARRRLFRNPWTTFTDCLLPLSDLEAVFGLCNRRTMDVIALQAEVLYNRGQFPEVEVEAYLLIQRAGLIATDHWQRFYNWTRGYYFLGCAQYFQGKSKEAEISFLMALWADEELCALDDFGIFSAEKETMRRYLENMRGCRSQL